MSSVPTAVLYVTWDADGRPPTVLGAAREAVASGSRAVVLGHRSQRASVEAAGVEFETFRLIRHGGPEPLSSWTTVGLRRDLVDALLRLRPGLVVLDEELLGQVGIGLDWLAGLPRSRRTPSRRGIQPAIA